MNENPNAKPPEEILGKLAQLQKDFPEGFILCIAPKEKGTWFQVYRWNPKALKIVNALHEHIIGNQIHGGTQN